VLIPSGDDASGTVTSIGFTQGSGIALSVTPDNPITSSGTVTIAHGDTSSQASINNSGRTYIQDITLDDYGHVTALSSATETVTNTTYEFANGTGGFTVTPSGGSAQTVTVAHPDTSSQSSVDNSGRTYIQDITLDSYGHVTGLSSATETVTIPSNNITGSGTSGNLVKFNGTNTITDGPALDTTDSTKHLVHDGT
jgi:hypothetical protein